MRAFSLPRFSFFLFLAAAVFLGGLMAPVASHAATKSSKDFVEVRKHKKAKKAKKKTAKKIAKKAPAEAKPFARPTRPYVEPVYNEDENVSEPSEMIVAIKNRAQRAYWEGKKPYKEQLASPQAGAAALTAPEASNTLRRISYSDIIGVSFDDQPLRMGASDTFRRSLEAVAFELGTPCRKPEDRFQEYLGWPLQQTEQSRVDRIFEETHARLKLRGFSVLPQRPKAAGQDVSVFTAERFNKHAIGMWSAGDAGLILLVCETEKHHKVAPAVTPDDKKKKIIKPKKKTKKPAPAKKKKIEVIPGASSSAVKETAPEKTESAEKPVPPNAPAAAPGSPPAAFEPAAAPTPVVETPKADTPVAPAPTSPAPSAPTPEAPKPVEVPAPTAAPPPTPSPTPSPTPAAPAPEVPVSAPAVPPTAAPAAIEAVKDAAKEAVKDAVVKELPKVDAPAVPAVPSIP